MTAILTLSDVAVVLGMRRIIDSASLALPEGEMLHVSGGSGSGKSVLASVCAGTLSPLEGRVTLFAGSTTDREHWAKARSDIGVAFQKPGLFRDYSVVENIAWPLLSRPDTRGGEAMAKASHLAISLGLQRVLRVRPGQLSPGQLRVAALARAMVTSPRLLILDEPLSGLDMTVAEKIEELLSRHLSSGSAVLCFGRDPTEFVGLGPRRMTLARGRLAP